MKKVALEVCLGCAMSEPYVADAVHQIRKTYGEDIIVIEQECLDVCQPLPAVRLKEEILLLMEDDIPALEEKIRCFLLK